jgi:restriction endonuclease S subunit
MKSSSVLYLKLRTHKDWRWDSEFLCNEPFHNKKLTYKPIGDTLTLSQYGISIDMNEDGNGTRIYRMNEISDMFCDREINKYAKVTPVQVSRFKLKDNDVLFNRTNSLDFVGRTGIYKKFSDENIVFASYLIRVRTNESEVLPEYLTAFLNTRYGIQDVKRRARISINQSNINAKELKRVEIPILSKEIQEIIRNLFDLSFNLVNKSESLYREAERILLSELCLLDWEPRHRLSFIKNFSDAQSARRIDAEYFQPIYEEIIRSVKSSKQFAYLGDIVSIKKCIEPGSEAYKDSGIPFVRVSNLSKFGFNNDNQQFLSESLYEILKTHQPKTSEILLSKDATPGIAFYLKDKPEKMIPSGGILRLTVKDNDKIFPEYLTLVLNSVIVQKQIERDSGGSIINHWLVNQVRNTLIPILPFSVQRQISEKIEHSFSCRKQSKHFLYIAKRGVEIAIEKDEQTAIKWISEQKE